MPNNCLLCMKSYYKHFNISAPVCIFIFSENACSHLKCLPLVNLTSGHCQVKTIAFKKSFLNDC